MVRINRAFTLLELLIVVIIVGILASLAIPRYIKTTENAKGSEAMGNLGVLREAEWRYFMKHQVFESEFNNLDVENPNVTAVYFNYDMYDWDNSGMAFYISAQRKPISPYQGNYIVVDQDGNFTGSWPPGIATLPE